MTTAPRPEVGLVIFDCDGVLVDSETISVAVLLDFLVGAGVGIGEDDAYRLFLGRSMPTVIHVLRRDFGFVLGEEGLRALGEELFRRFRRDLKPMAGAAEALERISVPRCVASSGDPERIRLSLGVTGLLEMLEPHLYSASMVERGKPAPDLFLHAAHAMGVEPAACVVVEDSPAGIDAAHRAGMRVFAFTGGAHCANGFLIGELAKRRPDLVFDDLRKLPDLLHAGRVRA